MSSDVTLEKPGHLEEARGAPSAMAPVPPTQRQPLRHLLIIVASIFGAEVVVMGLLVLIPEVSETVRALIDATLLLVLVSPLLYRFLAKPMWEEVERRRRAEAERAAALADSERRNQDLQQFAHVLSHDLKAPLRGAGKLSAWLRQDYRHKLDDRGIELLDLMSERLEFMDTMIDGILAYARAGSSNADRLALNTNRAIESALTALSPPAEIEIRIQQDIPRVYAVHVLLQQVLQNLLSNAFKHVEPGRGLVEIGGTERGAWVELYVLDNGSGIDPADHERVFEIFTALDRRGFGIGLATVKRIVEDHGGEIWIESALGKGTTFYFTLPKPPGRQLSSSFGSAR